MTAQAHKLPETGEQTTETTVQAPEAGDSNSAAQDELRGKEGTDAGLANYQASLGSWLGGELYKAVAPHLTLEMMSGYADDGFSGALKGLVGLLDQAPGEIDEGGVDKFAEALAKTYEKTAGEWLESDGAGLAKSLAGWVDAHPKTIVTVALLAAAGAIAANIELPELKQKIGLGGGFTAEVEAKLGKIRDIALEKIKAKLSWTSGPLIAAIQVSHEDGETQGEASVALKGEDAELNGKLQVDEDGLNVYEVKGLMETAYGTASAGLEGGRDQDPQIVAKLKTVDGSHTETKSVTYDTGTQVLKLGRMDELKFGDDGENKLTVNNELGSDGTGTTGAAVEGQVTDKLSGKIGLDYVLAQGDADSAYDLTDEVKANFGLKLDTEDFDLEFGTEFSSLGESELSGKLSTDLGGNFSLGADAELKLSDSNLYEVGGYFGFRDPKQFSTYMAKYRYTSQTDTHNVDLLMEEKLGDIYGRLSQRINVSPTGESYETGIHGAMDINSDWKGIAGARLRLDEQGEFSAIPEVGVQVGGVPLMVGYDTGNKAVTIGITIPFGR